MVCRCLDQSLSGAGARLLQVFTGTPNGAAAIGGHALIDPSLLQAPVSGCVLRLHLTPVALEFLGYDHGHRGENALPHFRLGDADGDGVVRRDEQPGVDLCACSIGGRYPRFSRDRSFQVGSCSQNLGAGQVKTQCHPPARGGGGDDEISASQFSIECHDGFSLLCPR